MKFYFAVVISKVVLIFILKIQFFFYWKYFLLMYLLSLADINLTSCTSEKRFVTDSPKEIRKNNVTKSWP
jgi:hypothetical protein